MSLDNGIAKRIKISRSVAGLKQRELADKVGVSLITIARWENPESGRSPNSAMINKLAEAMNTSAGYLMGLEDMPERQKRLPLIEPSENPAVEEKASLERNPKMATFTSKNGEHFEAPATAEGYAFLERMLAISMGLPATAPAMG